MRYFFAGILILIVLCHPLYTLAQVVSPFAKKYTPSFTQGSVKKYIRDIESVTGVNISYSDAYVNQKRTVKLSATETTVYDALQLILADQKVQLQESGDKILILSGEAKTVKTAPGNITINGYVKDKANKEVLIGAIIYIPELGIGTATNNYGFYSLSFTSANCKVMCSYLGYITDTFSLNGNNDVRRDIQLSYKANLQEVKVVHEKETTADHINLGYSDITKRPAILGENDVMRALQYVSGVQSGTDGTNAVMVRGGDPGQNLNLLDGVPLYYVDHFFGLTSVYNTEAIKAVDFHKGAFPSRFGGRLSSVIDVSTKDGDMERWGGQFTMGLIKGSLNLEGPIIKDKASIMLSARRTWFDLIWRPFTKALTVNFYDINGKANYIINKNNRIYLSVYNGRDGIGYKVNSDETKGTWGNSLASLKWNTIVNPKLFLNTTLTYSKFKFHLVDNQQLIDQNNILNAGSYQGNSSVNDMALHLQATWFATAHQHIEFGTRYSNAQFVPADVSLGNGALVAPVSPTDKFRSNEFDFYAEDAISINSRWTIRPGLHFANWFSQSFNYSSLQPRFYTAYKLTPCHTIYASYAQMAQFLHLINNNTYGLPTDFWLPSSSRIEPEESALITAGYMGKPNKIFSYNLEGYYKDIENTITYDMGKNLFDNSLKWDEKIIQGRGWSYGGEASAKVKVGPFALSAAYTLSYTYRKFAQLNEGKAFPYRFDRRHNIRTSLLYQPSEKFDAVVSWIYMSGEHMTLPDQIYPDFDNNMLITSSTLTRSSNYTYNYTKWNNYTLPAIHRLDVGFNFTKKKRLHYERTWSIGMFNVYGRRNIMSVELTNESNDGGSSDFKLKGMSFLSFIPYISYNLRF